MLLFNSFHLNSDFIADNKIRNDKERLTETRVHTAAVSRGEKMVMCRNILNKIIARFRWTMHSLYAIIYITLIVHTPYKIRHGNAICGQTVGD